MKRLLWFSLGVTFGVLVTFFYEVFGKPALPKVERCRLDFGTEYDPPETFYPDVRVRIVDPNNWWIAPDVPPSGVTYTAKRTDEKDDWYAFGQSFDDTQPVRTHD